MTADPGPSSSHRHHRRPPDEVNAYGSKAKWAAIIAVNFVGPVLYFTKGRRKAAARLS